jgi:ribose/xylose/arabinose/galactoside ABC-type transport system permease subunit
VCIHEVALTLAAAVVAGAWFVLASPGLEAEPARYAVVGALPLVLLALQPAVFGPLAGALLARLRREPLPRVLGAGQVARFLALYTSRRSSAVSRSACSSSPSTRPTRRISR